MFDTAELRILHYLGSAFDPDLISFAFTFSEMNITFISVFYSLFFLLLYLLLFHSLLLFLFTSPSQPSFLCILQGCFITAFHFSELTLLVSFVCV